jgi:hypothetical protein
MKKGDLVRLYEDGSSDEDFTIGSLNPTVEGSWSVPCGTIALVVKVVPDEVGEPTCHILVDGKMGWAYEYDCEVIDETR